MTPDIFNQTERSSEMTNNAAQAVFQAKLALLTIIALLITLIRFL